MKSVKHTKEIVQIDKQYEDVLENWNNTIEIDDDKPNRDNQYKAPSVIRNVPQEYIVKSEDKIDFKGNATFSLVADKLEIHSDNPPLDKEIILCSCDDMPEERVEKDNLFKKYFKEIKECPTFAALKENYSERLFHNPDDGRTWLKCTDKETGDIIYLDEDLMKEELLQFRGIDLDNLTADRGPGGGPDEGRGGDPPSAGAGAYMLLNAQESHNIDMIIQKLEDNRSQDITQAEKMELLELLDNYTSKSFGEKGHEAEMYNTELGRIVYFGNKAECFEEFAIINRDGKSPNTLQLVDGRELPLEKFLKESYHRDMKGEEIKEQKQEENKTIEYEQFNNYRELA